MWFLTHPLEIIKTAANRTNNWSMELEVKIIKTLTEKNAGGDKWFNSLPRGKQ